MLKSKEAKEIILKGARELFPQILPSRLQEARSALLSHLSLREEDFGYFPSGGSKFENYCSQVVSDLKFSGEMRTEGWTWIWKTDFQTPDWFSMIIENQFEEVEEAPTLYNLDDEETMIRLIAITPCFGKVVQSDEECQGCPLFNLCLEKKGEVKQAKKDARKSKNQALKEALDAGYDLKGIKIPKSARVHEAEPVTCLSNTTCIATGSAILESEKAIRIPSWGIIKKDIYSAIKQITK